MKLQEIDGPLRWRVAIGAAVLFGGILFLLWMSPGQTGESAKPKLALMTSMPLIWPEGEVADAIKNADEVPAVKQRLEQKFEIIPADDLDVLNNADIKVMLMAQPRALTPAELVRLEDWVGAGGNVVILADPALQWESSFPLGDPRRPLFTSMLSPLFAHWGLALTLPMDQQDVQKAVEVDEMQLQLAAYGLWQNAGASKVADCKIADPAVLASCDVGKGRAILLADADLLATELWTGTGLGSFLGSDGSANMNWLEERLLDLAK